MLQPLLTWWAERGAREHERSYAGALEHRVADLTARLAASEAERKKLTDALLEASGREAVYREPPSEPSLDEETDPVERLRGDRVLARMMYAQLNGLDYQDVLGRIDAGELTTEGIIGELAHRAPSDVEVPEAIF